MPEQQPDLVPEMDLEVLIYIMRTSFDIVHETVEGKPYAVRFVGSPYNTFVEDCRHIQIFTHNKGRSVSPHNIKSILAKFNIDEKVFMEAAFSNRPPTPIPSSPSDSKDVKPN